eukprot:TRINITY_DN107031_c0_g1_i1.p1 TRINITY_DN107031_c0_g1~~TRINITY_DN107031_c0_g1_i1.p1  ORF type:complete len:247 (+),score=29.56 TRINITY_DN107031_c0_g1_i1:72-812(+)
MSFISGLQDSDASSIDSGHQMAEWQPEQITLVVMGPTGVGKSALVQRYKTASLTTLLESTIEEDHCKYIKLNGSQVQLKIKDTGGSEDWYKGRHLAWFQAGNDPSDPFGSAAFLFVFALDNKQSFDRLQELHKEFLKAHPEHPPPSVLVANKADLDRSEWAVAEHEVEALHKQWTNCRRVIFTSALSSLHVDKAFEAAALGVHERRRQQGQTEEQQLQPRIISNDRHRALCSIRVIRRCAGACLIQ